MPKPRSIPPKQNIHEEKNVRDLWMSHEGSDIFVVGTGTSLTDFDWSLLEGRITIGLNDALLSRLIPTFHIFCDVGLWKRYRDYGVDPSTKVICQRRARDKFLDYASCSFKKQVYHFNHVAKMSQIKVDNDDLYISRTVATGGITLAWKLGARRIFLLGIDGYKRADGVYYHDGQRKKNEKRKERKVGEGIVTQDRHDWWIKNMGEVRTYFNGKDLYMGKWPESGVYNLSPHSVFDDWQKIELSDVFDNEMNEKLVRELENTQRPIMSLQEHRLFLQSLVDTCSSRISGDFVEIGVHRAQSTLCVLQVLRRLKSNRNLYSIDHPLAESRVAPKWREATRPYNNAKLIFKSSHDPVVLKRFRDVAWLFIDGCHCFECALSDIDLWGPKVTIGGYMVVHDTSTKRNYQKTDFCLDAWDSLPEACRTEGAKSVVRRLWGVEPALQMSKVIRDRFQIEHCDDIHGAGIRIYKRVK